VGEWYYIGHYGQLGPLTRDQLNELIEGEVVAHDTYVWKIGMSEWVAAGSVSELSIHFASRAPAMNPPPPPGPPASTQANPTYVQAPFSNAPVFASYPHTLVTLKSDRNRVLGGILQLVIPGVGRMYLGYGALGVLQLISTLCGVGAIWSVIDGILILCGNVKYDGYGRRLGD